MNTMRELKEELKKTSAGRQFLEEAEPEKQTDNLIEFAKEQCEIFPEDSYMGKYLRETLKMLQAEQKSCGDVPDTNVGNKKGQDMTKEEAINLVIMVFDTLEGECNIEYDWSKEHKARDMAIKALEQESVVGRDCEHCSKTYGTLGCCDTVSNKWVYSCKEGQREYIFGKIKAEIEALPKTYPFINHIDMYVKEDDVVKIIDKYKAGEE